MIDVLTESQKIQAIIDSAVELRESGEEYEEVLDFIGDATIVLIGESTVGTREFHDVRAKITKNLIEKKGFKAIAVAGDFAVAESIHQYIHGDGQSDDLAKAIFGTGMFPDWVWNSPEMANFFRWLRLFNNTLKSYSRPIGFYGLDPYNFYRSSKEILDYLDRVNPSASAVARNAFASFEDFGGEASKSGFDELFRLNQDLENETIVRLTNHLKDAPVYSQLDSDSLAGEEFCTAQQKFRIVSGAEQYYRGMLRDRSSLWHNRDAHMAESLQQVRQHLERHGELPKVVVWAHNIHSGDARATEMSRQWEFNFGQLVKQSFGVSVVSIGLTTYAGTVTASSSWNGIAESHSISPAVSESYEDLFHKTGMSRFFLEMKSESKVTAALRDPLQEKSIGILLPDDDEDAGHCFSASLPFQFDAIIHIDNTMALASSKKMSPGFSSSKGKGDASAAL